MSGIRAGSRLEQLHDLRRQITLRIEHARRTGSPAGDLLDLAQRVDDEIRAEGGTPPPTPAGHRPRRRTRRPATEAARAQALLIQLGVTSTEVKTWAVSVGLLDRVKRGQIAVSVVEAYATHQQLDQIIRKATP